MPVDWSVVRGRIVFDSTAHPVRESNRRGFSMTGTRRFLVTDAPAVYVHDTGGLGEEFLAVADPAAEPDVQIALVERSTRLSATLTLAGGRGIQVLSGPLPPASLAQLTGLAGRLLPDAAHAAFTSPCAVSVTLEHEDAGPPTGPPGPPAAAEELVCSVVVRSGRLELQREGRTVLDWPLSRIAVTQVDPTTAVVRGGAVLDGRFVNGAVLHLVAPEVCAALVAAAADVQDTTALAGTSVRVLARGLTGPDEVPADCVLADTALELDPIGTDAPAVRFDLDAGLRVAGTAERFVLFSPTHGPVGVRCAEETFTARLHNHPAVAAAARRTLAAGPFPVELADGRVVACAVSPEGLRAKGPDVDLTVPFAAVTTVQGVGSDRTATLRVEAGEASLAVVGQADLIQALHTAVVAGMTATAAPGQVPDLLRAAAGLEEDWWLSSVFGPYYELHAALLGDGEHDLTEPATLAEDPARRAHGVALLSAGLPELLRHLDRVLLVLPSFVRHRDAELLAAAGRPEPAWLAGQEAALRGAVAPVQRAATETAQILAQVARLVDLDPAALPKVNYAGAAVSLGAAALLNPVFAVSGVSQAYSQYSSGEKRKAQVGAQAERSWAVALDRWNELLAVTLPALGFVLTENVFGVRWQTARRLAEELAQVPAESRPAAVDAVARRVAVLDVIRRYPSAPGVRLRRGEIAAHLREARDVITTPHFVDF